MAFLLSLACCSEPDDSPELPEFINPLFDLFVEENQNCEGAQVGIYTFEDMEVSVFAQGSCITDASTSVFNSDCEEICYLGGIAGIAECNGKPFFDSASLVSIVWER